MDIKFSDTNAKHLRTWKSESAAVPRTGDKILLGENYYKVVNVLWVIPGLVHIILEFLHD